MWVKGVPGLAKKNMAFRLRSLSKWRYDTACGSSICKFDIPEASYLTLKLANGESLHFCWLLCWYSKTIKLKIMTIKLALVVETPVNACLQNKVHALNGYFWVNHLVDFPDTLHIVIMDGFVPLARHLDIMNIQMSSRVCAHLADINLRVVKLTW